MELWTFLNTVLVFWGWGFRGLGVWEYRVLYTYIYSVICLSRMGIVAGNWELRTGGVGVGWGSHGGVLRSADIMEVFKTLDIYDRSKH